MGLSGGVVTGKVLVWVWVRGQAGVGVGVGRAGGDGTFNLEVELGGVVHVTPGGNGNDKAVMRSHAGLIIRH